MRVAIALAGALLAVTPANARDVRGITDTEIVLGTHTDLSGPAASPGSAATNALRMRIDEINGEGGIYGRKIKLVVEDAQYQVPRAVQAGNKLINKDKVFAIIAGLGTPMTNAIFPLQEKEGVPNLYPNAQSRIMWYPFNRLKFQFNADNRQVVSVGVQYFINKGKKKFCVEYQDTDFGKDILAGVEEELAAKKMMLTAKEGHKPIDSDLGTQILNLRSAGCDVVFLGALIRDSIIAYTTARRSGWTDVDFVGSSSAYDPAVAAVPDQATEGFFAVTPTWIGPLDQMPAAAQAFHEKYKSLYNKDAPPAAINAYVGMSVVAVGLEKAGKDITLDKFIAAMESIKGYQDIFAAAPQSYSSEMHLGSRSAFIVQVKNGDWTKIDGPIEAPLPK